MKINLKNAQTIDFKGFERRFGYFAMIAAFMFMAAEPSAGAVALTTAGDFLLMTTGARPDGMGQAFSAVADDINTLSFNPAGLGNIRLPEVGYGYESFAAGINYDFVGAALPMGEAGVLGLGYIDMGTPPFNSTANPEAPMVSAEDRAVILGWGKSLYDVHVGWAVKYIIRQMDTDNASGFGFDLGIRYRPSPYLTLAASVMNIGTGIRIAGWEPLPTLLNTGLAFTAVEEPVHTLTLAVNLSSNLATDTQQFGVGGEYWYKDTFAIRAGYLAYSMDRDFNPDGFSAGAGIRFPFFQLDYAYQPFNTLGMMHRVSGIVRWDGPWISNGEPNPPKYVKLAQTPRGIEVRWERPQGPMQFYEVSIQPLDGSGKLFTKKTSKPPYYFTEYAMGVLYKVTVKTVNGSAKSFPSKEAYIETRETLLNLAKSPRTEKQAPSVAMGVNGQVDAVGLRLTWPVAEGAMGYNLYRQSPSGIVEKVNQVMKRDNNVWVTDISGLAGWKWIVSALGVKGEKTVGTFLWHPTSREMDLLGQRPRVTLHASPEPGRKVYLDWKSEQKAAKYSLFFSDVSDGVLEYCKDFDQGNGEAFLKILTKEKLMYFLIAPKSPGGEWTSRSNQAMVEFLPENTDE